MAWEINNSSERVHEEIMEERKRRRMSGSWVFIIVKGGKGVP